MSGLNNVSLVGRLSSPIDLKKTTSGKSVVTFSIAIKRPMQNVTDFIDCVAWNQSAEYLNSYAHKGDWISVVGSIQKRAYESSNGKRYITEVISEKVSIIQKAENTTPEVQEQTPTFDVPDIPINNDDLPF